MGTISKIERLFFVILGLSSVSLSLLAGKTSRTATTEGRGEREVDELSVLNTHEERSNVDGLLSNTDVSLLDEGTSVVDGLGESALEDEGLETALEEVSGLQVEAVINAILVLREDTVAVEAAHEGLAFEKTSGVVLLKGKEGTGGLSDLGEGKVDAPDFTLATKTVLSAELELSIKTLTLKGATGSLGDLTVVS